MTNQDSNKVLQTEVHVVKGQPRGTRYTVKSMLGSADGVVVAVLRKGNDLVVQYEEGRQVVVKGFYGPDATLENATAGDAKPEEGAPAEENVAVLEQGEGSVPCEFLSTADAGIELSDGSQLLYVEGNGERALAHLPQDTQSAEAVIQEIQTRQQVACAVDHLPEAQMAASDLFAISAAFFMGGSVLDSLITGSSAGARNVVSGTVTAGPVVTTSDIWVAVFDLNGKLLGSQHIGANGAYEIDVGAYTGGVVVKAYSTDDQGLDFMDEATGQAKNLNVTLLATGVIVNPKTVVNINPVTSVASEMLGLKSADGTGSVSGGTDAEKIAKIKKANAAIAKLVGVTGTLTEASVVTTITADGSDNKANANVLGKFLDVMSEMDHKAGGGMASAIQKIAGATNVDTGEVRDEVQADILVAARDAGLAPDAFAETGLNKDTRNQASEFVPSSLNDVTNLTPSVAVSLSGTQIQAIFTHSLASQLSISALRVIDPKIIGSLPATQINQLTAPQVAGMTDAQLGILTSDQASAINDAHGFDALTPHQVTVLSADAIDSVPSSVLGAMASTDVATLTPAQVFALGKAKALGNFKAGALSTIDLAALPGAQTLQINQTLVDNATAGDGGTLTIKGATGDVIEVTDGLWMLTTEPVLINGVSYNVYKNNAGDVLQVQTGVTCNITLRPTASFASNAGGFAGNTAGAVMVESSKAGGTAYLVRYTQGGTEPTVVTDITNANDADWNSVDLPATANTETALALSGLSEGTYRLYVADADGRLSAAASQTFTVDNTRPIASFASGSVRSGNVTSDQASVTSSEAGGKAYLVRYTQGGTEPTVVADITNANDADWNSVDLPATANTPASLALTGLKAGTYRLYVADAAGNLSVAAADTFTVDNTAPTGTLTSAVFNVANRVESNSVAHVHLNAGGTVYLVSDAVSINSLVNLQSAPSNQAIHKTIGGNADETLNLSGLAEGTYHLWTVNESTGEYREITDASIIIDYQVPTAAAFATGTKLAGNSTGADYASVASSEAGTAYLVLESVAVDSLSDITGADARNWAQVAVTAASLNTPAHLPLNGLNEGTYHLYVADAAGNLSAAAAQTFTVDNAAPNGTPTATLAEDTGSPGDGITRNDRVNVDISGVTGADYWKVRIDDGEWTQQQYSLDTTHFPLTQGSHTYHIAGFDNAGNQSAEVTLADITLDTIAPSFAANALGAVATTSANVVKSNATNVSRGDKIGVKVALGEAAGGLSNLPNANSSAGTSLLRVNGESKLASWYWTAGGSELWLLYTVQPEDTGTLAVTLDQDELKSVLGSMSIQDRAGNQALIPASFNALASKSYGVAEDVPVSSAFTVAGDNYVNASEKSNTTNLSYSRAAPSSENKNLKVYVDDVLCKSVPATNNNVSVGLTGTDWGGDGMHTITVCMADADGNTSPASGPKTVVVDTGLAQGFSGVFVSSDTGTLDSPNSGDVVRVSFKEPVNITTASLSSSIFGTGATVTAVGSIIRGKAQSWDITLGTNPSQSQFTNGGAVTFTGVTDIAGNTGTIAGEMPSDLFNTPGQLSIGNVTEDNVINSAERAVPRTVRVDVTRLVAGDMISLYMDGQLCNTVEATATDASNKFVNIAIDANQWGADGERVLSATAQRGSGDVISGLIQRHVYVAADGAHWSAVKSGYELWFDPDTLPSSGMVGLDNTITANSGQVNFNASVGGARAYAETTGERPTISVLNGRQVTVYGGGQALRMTEPTTAYTVPSGDEAYYVSSAFMLTQESASWNWVTSMGAYGTAGGSIGLGFCEGTSVDISTYGCDAGAFNSATLNLPSQMSFVTRPSAIQDKMNAALIINGLVNADLVPVANAQANYNNALMTGKIGGANSAWRGYIGRQNKAGGAEYTTGAAGDIIYITGGTSVAQLQEMDTYVGQKYATIGTVVHPSESGDTYDLAIHSNASRLLDDVLTLNTTTLGTGNDTVITAGADFVATGGGKDTVIVKDLNFRSIDGGKGADTLRLHSEYNGSDTIYLADYVSNARGISAGTGGLSGRDNALSSWVKGASAASAVANCEAAPDGTMTADKLTLTNSTIASDYYGSFSGLASGSTYTFSIWVKLGTATNLDITFDNITTPSAIPGDGQHDQGKLLSTGQIGNLSTTEWARIDAPFVADSGGKVNVYLGAVNRSSQGVTYTQSAGEVYLWGAELNKGNAPDMPTSQQLIDDARVNTNGFHKLQGFEEIDLAGSLAAQSLKVNPDDVNQLSEDNTLWIKLGSTDATTQSSADTLMASGFTDDAPTWGYYSHTETDGTTVYYDRKWTGTSNGSEVNLYALGGDVAEVTDATTGGTGSNKIATGSDEILIGTNSVADTFVWVANTSGTDSVTSFSKTEGDKIDLRGILTGASFTSSSVGQFLEITQSGVDAVLKIDVAGTSGFNSPTQQVTFINGWSSLSDSLPTLLAQKVILT